MRARNCRGCTVLNQTLRSTLDILLLRSGPQDMPSSWALLQGLTAAFLIINALTLATNLPPVDAVVNAAVVTALLALFTHALLRRRQLQLRFAQTFTAIMATGAVLSLVGIWPILGLQPFFEALRALPPNPTPEQLPQPPLLPALGYLVIGSWQLVAVGQVYRHALDVTLGRGMMLAMVYQLVLLLLLNLVSAF